MGMSMRPGIGMNNFGFAQRIADWFAPCAFAVGSRGGFGKVAGAGFGEAGGFVGGLVVVVVGWGWGLGGGSKRRGKEGGGRGVG